MSKVCGILTVARCQGHNCWTRLRKANARIASQDKAVQRYIAAWLEVGDGHGC